MKENNCIFCKIGKGETSCHKIYENKKFIAFLDIKPISHGHILIIPKKHIIWMQEADDKTISEIFKITKKLMLVLKKSLKCDFVQVGVVGSDVPHFHVHLIPRYYKDNLPSWPTKDYDKNHPAKLVKKITSKL